MSMLCGVHETQIVQLVLCVHSYNHVCVCVCKACIACEERGKSGGGGWRGVVENLWARMTIGSIYKNNNKNKENNNKNKPI